MPSEGGAGIMRAHYLGHMDASDSLAPSAASASTKRGRKPKIGSQQLLSEARKSLALAQDRHEKALARVAREERAELARTGRQIYLRAIEQMHAGERALLVDQVLSDLAEDDRSAIQVWIDSLTLQKKS